MRTLRIACGVDSFRRLQLKQHRQRAAQRKRQLPKIRSPHRLRKLMQQCLDSSCSLRQLGTLAPYADDHGPWPMMAHHLGPASSASTVVCHCGAVRYAIIWALCGQCSLCKCQAFMFQEVSWVPPRNKHTKVMVTWKLNRYFQNFIAWTVFDKPGV